MLRSAPVPPVKAIAAAFPDDTAVQVLQHGVDGAGIQRARSPEARAPSPGVGAVRRLARTLTLLDLPGECCCSTRARSWSMYAPMAAPTASRCGSVKQLPQARLQGPGRGGQRTELEEAGGSAIRALVGHHHRLGLRPPSGGSAVLPSRAAPGSPGGTPARTGGRGRALPVGRGAGGRGECPRARGRCRA